MTATGTRCRFEYGFSRLTLHAYVWRIEIACGGRIITIHERCYDKGQGILDIDHYLPLLIQRPGAFPYARPVRQWKMPAVYREIYEALCRKHNGYGVREFLQVLALPWEGCTGKRRSSES